MTHNGQDVRGRRAMDVKEFLEQEAEICEGLCYSASLGLKTMPPIASRVIAVGVGLRLDKVI